MEGNPWLNEVFNLKIYQTAKLKITANLSGRAIFSMGGDML